MATLRRNNQSYPGLDYLHRPTRGKTVLVHRHHRFRKVFESLDTDEAYRRALREKERHRGVVWTGEKVPEGRVYGVFVRRRSPLRIVPVDSKIAGYFGEMHSLAARELGLPYPHGPETLAVVRGLSEEDRAWHIKHGSREYDLMRRGATYRKAHAQVLLDMGDYKSREAALRDSDRMIKIARAWRKRHR